MIQSEVFNNKNVLTFQNVNRLNFLNINEVTDFLEQRFTDTNEDLYLNLTGIKFIDSFAFEKLIAVHHFANSINRKFKLFNVSEELGEIFLFTGISKKLSITDDREVFEKQSHEYHTTFTG